MSDVMEIKLTKHWNGFVPGHVFLEMPRGMARVLLERGFAIKQPEKKKNDNNNQVSNAERSSNRTAKPVRGKKASGDSGSG